MIRSEVGVTDCSRRPRPVAEAFFVRELLPARAEHDVFLFFPMAQYLSESQPECNIVPSQYRTFNHLYEATTYGTNEGDIGRAFDRRPVAKAMVRPSEIMR